MIGCTARLFSKDIKVDLLVAAIRKAEKVVIPSHLNDVSNGLLSKLCEIQKFQGSHCSTLIANVCNDNLNYAGLVGYETSNRQFSILDKFSDINSKTVSPREAASVGKSLAEMISATKATSVAFLPSSDDWDNDSIQSFVSSLFVSLRKDLRYKSKPDSQEVPTFDLLSSSEALLPSYQTVLDNATVVAEAVVYAKELVNTPANICTTEYLGQTARNIADKYAMDIKILGKEDCKLLGMGSYLAVHQGSMYEPQFIHLTYKPNGANPNPTKFALIGKGICMDTGGYNLKVGCGIETMKMDMGGAAAVLGAAHIIGSVKPQNIEVHFIVPAAENMISSTAYRPGDIVTAMNGTTIEVGNTDAEGRLTLCDALHYAESTIHPNYLLDCATLTGACIVGLGESIGGLYSNDSDWMKRVLSGGKATGSPVWPMPLFTDYRKSLDSRIADMNNVSNAKGGGSITAALFLKDFVKHTPWCHLDLAGPAWNSEEKAGTGYGVSMLANTLLSVDRQAI